MKTETLTKVVVESAEAVLGLHWFVARDYTARDEGLSGRRWQAGETYPVKARSFALLSEAAGNG